jgi:multiple sugar transport system substrate-binding protein
MKTSCKHHPLRFFTFLALSAIGFLSCTNDVSIRKEITFWAMGAEGGQIQKMVPEFENQTGIKVRIQSIPWTAAQEKLITAFASNNLPDAFQLGNTWIPEFTALHAIEDLDPWISPQGGIDRENYFQGIWDTNEIDSVIYGIPWYIDTRIFFYRKDILERAGFLSFPKTWDELYSLCRKIKKTSPDSDRYPIYIPTNEWAPFVIFGLQAGSSILKENNSYGDFSGDSFRKAFSYLIRFHEEHLAPIGISQVTNIYQAFAEGYLAMYISGPWNIPEFKRAMTGPLQNQWMTASLPGPEPGLPGISLAGGSSLVMAGRSTQKENVWKWFEYLSLPATQIRFYDLTSDLPAVREAWKDPLLKDDPFMKAFFTQFENVVSTPKIPEWEQIAFLKIQQYAESAARGVMDIDQALNALDKDVDQILEKRRWMLRKQAEKAHEK